MKTILVILSLLALVACEQGKESSTSAAPSEPIVSGPAKIYVYGDEISKCDAVTTCYTQILSQRSGLQIVNRSYSHTQANAPATMNNVLNMNNNPLRDVGTNDIVLIFAGYNDVRWGGNLTNYSGYATYYTAFFNLAYNTGAQVYIVSPIKMKATSYALPFTLWGTSFDQGSDVHMNTFKNMLQNSVTSFHSSGVRFVNMTDNFNPIDANLDSDKQYPNDNGHQIIGDYLIQEMGL